MTRRAILLIGTEKTGTTTLQQFLARNRARLAARGFLYPDFCGDHNHTGLAAYALDPTKDDEIRIPFGYRSAEDLPGMRARIEAAAREELSATGGTVLFCSEHCHSRLIQPDEIATLERLLRPFFESITVAVYLRRQDQVALSLYATQIKSGATHGNLIPDATADDPYYNHDRSLQMWGEVFGESHVVPRIFDRAQLIGGSVVTDYCSTWGLGPVENYQPVPDFNGAISAAAVEFLRHANAHLRGMSESAAPSSRGMLVGRLEELFPGRGPRPSRAEAQAFYDRFRSSNMAICRRHFPDRETLFEENFDSYPEVADDRALAIDDATLVGLRLHLAGMADNQRLEAEIALRDGRLHWLAQRQEEAIAALRRAVRLNPEHPEMQRTLAEYLFQIGAFVEAAMAAAAAAERRPESAEYWHFLGMALRRSGRRDRAAQAQTRALGIQPDYPAARQELDLVTRSPRDAEALPPEPEQTERRHAS